MCPRAACTIVPGIAMIAMNTRDVPSARFRGIPSIVVTSGTNTMPPPTPSSPDTKPVKPPNAVYCQPGVEPRGRTRYVLERPMRTACHAISPAVTSSNQCGSIDDVIHAPAAAPAVPGIAANRTARQLTSRARA